MDTKEGTIYKHLCGVHVSMSYIEMDTTKCIVVMLLYHPNMDLSIDFSIKKENAFTKILSISK